MASPALTVRRPIPWVPPADLLWLKVPVPPKVSGVPVVPLRLPVTVSVPALIIVAPV